MNLVCYLLVLVCSLNGVWSKSINGDLSVLESSISTESCEFYAKLDEMIPCGENGYALSFAYKYCMVYLNEREEFINKEWQDGVRSCLQREMLSKLRQHSGESCDDIKHWGLSSHTSCYLRPIPNRPDINFCKLPAADMRNIVWAAKGVLTKAVVWLEFAGVTMECAGQYMQDVQEDVANYIRKLRAEIEEEIEEEIEIIKKEAIEFTIEGVKRWLLDQFNGDFTIINLFE
jgi:hypothetical protein